MPLIEEISNAPLPSSAAARAVAVARAQRKVPYAQPATEANGLDGDWSEPRGLTEAEVQTMARLREKYAGLGVRGVSGDDEFGGGGDTNTSVVDSMEQRLKAQQAKMDAEFLKRPVAVKGTDTSQQNPSKIRVCDQCRGERVMKQEYNHRVMEKMCDRCDGEGVLVAGKAMREGDGNENGVDSSNTDDPSSSPFAPGDALKKRLGVLHRDVKRLESQIDKYKSEMRDAQLRIDGEGDIPSGEEQALAEMIHQLQRHVQNLRLKVDAKRKEQEELAPGLFGEDDLEKDAENLP